MNLGDVVVVSLDDLTRAYITWHQRAGDEDLEEAKARAEYLYDILKNDPLNNKGAVQ